jgi:hypothetical protein
MKTCPIPPDVAGYMIAAATDLAKELGFQPSSERSLRTWMEANRVRIVELAREKMENLRDFLLRGGEEVEAVKEILCREVYNSIPKPAEQRWNPRYVAYASENGSTPDEMLARDGNMVNYLCWSSRTA